MSRELLFSVTVKDCRVDTFRSGGPGGQNQNKRSTGVRIVHIESGAVGESREHRTQEQNKTAAFRRMVASEKFESWRKTEAARRMGKIAEMEARVDRQMESRNIRVEVRDNDKWVQA